MTESKAELIRLVAEEAVRGRKTWHQDYLEKLTAEGITFTEVETEIGNIRREIMGINTNPAAAGTPLFTMDQLMSPTGIILTLAAIAIVYFSADSAIKTLTMPHWPTAPGKVISFTDPFGNEPGSRPMYSRTYAFVGMVRIITGDRLTYRYTVGGTTYESSNVRMGLTEDSDGALYPVGSTVMVNYNPRNPGEAYLENRVVVPCKAIFLLSLIASIFIYILNRSLKRELL